MSAVTAEARAQDTVPEPSGEGESLMAASALLELRRDYHVARGVFGESHISIFPAVFASRPFDCAGRCETAYGVAGALMAPLLGYGRGHELEWFPLLETDDEAESYQRFEKRARDLSVLVVQADAALSGDEARESAFEPAHYRQLADTFEDILRRDIAQGGTHRARSEKLLGCLHKLNASDDEVAWKLEKLDALWAQYDLLYGEDNFKRRHALLIGPVLALPLDERAAKQQMLGVAVELGGGTFGISLSGGLYSVLASVIPRGAWISLGLTGAFTSTVANGITGATELAREL